jgi:TRAP-type C4-dicarboxylate transport system permease small subunit
MSDPTDQPATAPAPPLRGVDAVARALDGLCVVLMFVLVMDVLWGVFSRYVLAAPSRWTDELATLLLVWVAMFGAASAHRHNMHLSVSWLLDRTPMLTQRLARRLIHGLIIVFALLIMGVGGTILVIERWRSGQVLPALGVPKAMVYVAVPIAGLLIALFSAAEIVRPSASETDPAAPEPAERTV